MSNTITRMRYLFDEALALAERKNADYGDAWQDNGWRGNLSRIFEKTKRLRNILWRGEKVDPVTRENVRETAIDMMNTLAFFIMNHDSGVEWGHEHPYPPVPYVSQPSSGNLAYNLDAAGNPVDFTPEGGWHNGVGQLSPETTARLATLGEQAAAHNLFESPDPNDLPVEEIDPPAAQTGKPSPHRRQPNRTK